MALWFAGMAVGLVWLVFRDPAVDYRLVALGAVAVDPLDLAWGGAGPAHSVVASAALLLLVMLATRGRRGLRRRLLAVPVGTFLHLLLDGAWADEQVFWWPFLGGGLGDVAMPAAERSLELNVGLEVAGVAAFALFARRFDLRDPERRRRFLRDGRLDRSLAGPPPIG